MWKFFLRSRTTKCMYCPVGKFYLKDCNNSYNFYDFQYRQETYFWKDMLLFIWEAPNTAQRPLHIGAKRTTKDTRQWPYLRWHFNICLVLSRKTWENLSHNELSLTVIPQHSECKTSILPTDLWATIDRNIRTLLR